MNQSINSYSSLIPPPSSLQRRSLRVQRCANLDENLPELARQQRTMPTRPRRPNTIESRENEHAGNSTVSLRSHAAQPTYCLRTKLLPPRPAPELLPRPRLTERLQANVAHPVTLVTAPAGSGKTTLVADFVRKHAQQFVWYQLDHTDVDPSVFLGYLAHGIGQAVAGFGDVSFSYLQQAA